MTDLLSNHQESLTAAIMHGLVDQGSYPKAPSLGPQLISNRAGDQIWDHLREELRSCQGFAFTVAFITDAMLSNLKPLLKNLATKGIRGRLLTATYLGFNQPKVFTELMKIPNLEVRIAKASGFHQKGYLFDHGDYQTAIVGSANLTVNAMLANRNQEWCFQISSLNEGALVEQVSTQVAEQWESATKLTTSWLVEYTEAYQEAKRQAPVMEDFHPTQTLAVVVPNAMQKEALKEIAYLRESESDRGLVISATGTGKTYLGAFDVQAVQPKRMLFLAHREQILKKARQSFQRVLGGQESEYGFYTGNEREKGAKYTFATIQTLSQDEHLKEFDPNAFDYILIDEVHHAGAKSYQRVMDYFKPAFFLGMTATPERNDDFSIFKLFDYQVAYEIRLQEALENDLLAPFHYVGISDYEFPKDDDQLTVDQYQDRFSDGHHHQEDQRAVELLSSSDRVAYILQQTNYYGFAGEKLHGLVFCSSVSEAEELAKEFSRQGVSAKALSGHDPVTIRQRVVMDFEQGKYNYLITVDIFNEGIDIPCVNQVVFLRSTQSAIVYVQQLGRGLRKYPGKEYVEVLDFIGNYKNSYMIPIALTGDDSYSKDQARETLDMEPTIGLSTIAFEEVARERIYATLKKTQLDRLANLRSRYLALKSQVGRVPKLMDFWRAHSVDPQVLVTAGKVKSYYQFLQKMGEDVHLTDYQERVQNFLATELVNGKRCQELLLLRELLTKEEVTPVAFAELLQKEGCLWDSPTQRSVEMVLGLSFYAKKAYPSQADYGGQPIVTTTLLGYQLNPQIRQSLKESALFRDLWEDAIEAGLARSQRYRPDQMMTVGEKYTRKDAVRLINNPLNVNAQIVSGYYFTNEESGLKEAIVFITYEKSEGIREEINYQNGFLNDRVVRYFMKQGDAKMSSKNFLRFKSGEYRLHLFMQKSAADDHLEYYYLGTCQYLDGSAELTNDGKRPRLGILLQLDQPLPYHLYHTFID
ncbi:DUF3427 domain-containing protein [Limosilactobacillus fermentum]|uniref:DUF3427 domain-containing protein n=1 Tax=Limosilactobacillus fermentum TaxID=1613 RepID=UPI00224459B2|nr:DEAD/DEAH box helicase [Limosilactobacillus fermentum]UZM85057.1 DEAD/DEAH box helicase [Limosilactobacillus fermentum]